MQKRMTLKQFLAQVEGQLIASCQALPDEPLHGTEIMVRMARAAKQGGARAIRANSPQDVKAIKEDIGLPVIGIYKDFIEIPSFHGPQLNVLVGMNLANIFLGNYGVCEERGGNRERVLALRGLLVMAA